LIYQFHRVLKLVDLGAFSSFDISSLKEIFDSLFDFVDFFDLRDVERKLAAFFGEVEEFLDCDLVVVAPDIISKFVAGSQTNSGNLLMGASVVANDTRETLEINVSVV
jgi:hypothetical protein